LGNKPEPIPIVIENAVLEAWGLGGVSSDALVKRNERTECRFGC